MSKTKKNIFVVGPGRWGSFIAWYLDSIGHDVTLYGRKSSNKMQALMETRQNEYLKLSDTLKLTTDITKVNDADIVVISVPSQNLADVCSQLSCKNKTIVLCMKGLDIKTGKRLSEIAKDNLDVSNKVAIWVGPGHVRNFYEGVPNCMIIDSENMEIKGLLVEAFSSDLIRFYYGEDIIGNEIGAAAKNVIGIAAGMLDGLNLSSLKGALMARGTHEISRLIKAMGGKPESAYGLCLLGDYEATLFNKNSHNLSFGRDFVEGKNYQKLAEGYYTAEAIHNISQDKYVETPICEAVYQVLYNQLNPSKAMDMLFKRNLKGELQ